MLCAVIVCITSCSKDNSKDEPDGVMYSMGYSHILSCDDEDVISNAKTGKSFTLPAKGGKFTFHLSDDAEIIFDGKIRKPMICTEFILKGWYEDFDTGHIDYNILAVNPNREKKVISDVGKFETIENGFVLTISPSGGKAHYYGISLYWDEYPTEFFGLRFVQMAE